ncbi:MAG: hypothetical protein ACJ76H_16345 [Bacteriovoracaceae bacterium]
MKPVNLNQLLLHPKGPCVSFYLPPLNKEDENSQWDAFFQDMAEQLILQERRELVKLLVKAKASVRKVMKSRPERAFGFYFSETLQGYSMLEGNVEAFCVFGVRFHVRPLLEEIFVNPEFILVNISLYDIRVYKCDFQHVEIIKSYEFDDFSLKDFPGATRVYAPQYMGMIPYKTILAIRSIAKSIVEMTLYNSLPVVVTGLEDMKKHFLKHLDVNAGVISNFEENFVDQTSVEISERCKIMRPAVTDFYSARMKERLKRMLKSQIIVTDIEQIVKSVSEGKVVHLVLPTERKLWGKIDLEKGTVEVHKKVHNKNTSVDILNELAEEVMRQGGKIQFLGPHYFPDNSQILAVLKGA